MQPLGRPAMSPELTRSKLGNSYDLATVENAQTEFLRELRVMYQRRVCADCGARNPNWVSLKRAVFVCIHCAQALRADAANRVKNCLGTYLWHPDEMDLMRNGPSE